MDEKKLYPLKFCALQDDYSWGRERFLLADLGYRDSMVRDGWLAGNLMGEVMDTYMDRMVGDNVYEYYGRQFPVCVRHIHADALMPLRVHPDNETARQRYDLLGKDKIWYVERCGRNSRIMLGFREDTDATVVFRKCNDNTVDSILNTVVPHQGQFLHIPPGTPHCAGGDIDIVEISQSSPVDICMCGWGEVVSTEEFDPALSLVDALDFIGYKAFRSDVPSGNRVELEDFSVERIRLSSVLHSYSGQSDSPVIYVCISGGAEVRIDVLGQSAGFAFGSGELVLVPAECNDFRLAPVSADTLLLEVEVPHIEEKDSYIDPSVPAETGE